LVFPGYFFKKNHKKFLTGGSHGDRNIIFQAAGFCGWQSESSRKIFGLVAFFYLQNWLDMRITGIRQTDNEPEFYMTARWKSFLTIQNSYIISASIFVLLCAIGLFMLFPLFNIGSPGRKQMRHEQASAISSCRFLSNGCLQNNQYFLVRQECFPVLQENASF